jgi:hypothetical protein
MKRLFLVLILAIPANYSTIAMQAPDVTTWNVSSAVPITKDFVFIHRVDPISDAEAFVVYKIPAKKGADYRYVATHTKVGQTCYNLDRDARNGFSVPVAYETPCKLFDRLRVAFDAYQSKPLDQMPKL